MDLAAKRREPRIRNVLPIRVFGLDSMGKPFTDVAHTLDISRGGARVGGLRYSLSVGDVIGVQRGNDKARFRVVWVGAPDTRCERQAGLCCIQSDRCIWPQEPLAEKRQDDYIPPSTPLTTPLAVATPSPERERRTDNRRTCNLGAELQIEGSAVKLWARCTDLSSGGCYLETRSPLSPGTSLRVQLSNKAMTFNAWGVVRTSHPHFGMGIQFDQLDSGSRVVLDMVLETLGEEVEAAPSRIPVTRTNLGIRAASLAEELRSLGGELASLNQPPAITAALSKTVKATSDTLSTLQQLIDSPLREDPKLISEQLLIHRIRAATTVNLELCSELTALPNGEVEARELLQATNTLARTLQMMVRTPSGKTGNEPPQRAIPSPAITPGSERRPF